MEATHRTGSAYPSGIPHFLRGSLYLVFSFYVVFRVILFMCFFFIIICSFKDNPHFFDWIQLIYSQELEIKETADTAFVTHCNTYTSS